MRELRRCRFCGTETESVFCPFCGWIFDGASLRAIARRMRRVCGFTTPGPADRDLRSVASAVLALAERLDSD